MARDGGEIQIRIGADASELNAESAKAAKSLAGIGGQATKTGKQLDKSADALKGSARRMGELTDGTQNTTDEFGELSSGAAALAAALDVVDPRLGAAARGLGDMAGSAEGALRLTRLQGGALSLILNPAVIAVTVAVGLAAGAWALFTKKLKTANETQEQAEERLNALLPKLAQVKKATMLLAVAQGKMSKEQMAALLIRRDAQALFQPERDAAQEALSAAKDEMAQAEKRLKLAQTSAHLNSRGIKDDDLRNQKIQLLTKSRQEQFATASAQVAIIELEIQRYHSLTKALVDSQEEIAATTKTTGKGTKGVEDSTKALLAHTAALAAAQMGARQMRDALAAEGDQFKELELQRKAAVGTRGDLFKQELDALEQLAKAGEDTAERQVIAHENFANDRDAINQSYTAKATALREEEAEAMAEIDALILAARDQDTAKQLADIDELKAKRIAAAWEVFEKSAMIGEELSSAMGALAQLRLQQAMAIEGEMTANQKKEAMRRWKIARATAIADGLLHMALAMVRAFEDHPLPYSLLMSALAGLSAGIAVAGVASQPPPSFLRGGIVPGSGAQPIIAHGGEGVLTAGATQSIGGKAGVDAINSGSITAKLDTLIDAVRSGGGVRVQLGHRQFDQFIKDDLRRPGSTLQQAIRKGARG